jgi:hypothetical protein
VDHSNTANGEGSEALQALRMYLSDSIAPLIFADTAQDMFKIPVQAVAAEILGWVASQSHIGEAVSTSDYLYHAVKKLHLLGELELIPRDKLKAFLDALTPYLLQSCPEHERASLATSLGNIEQIDTTTASAVGVGHAASGAHPVVAPRVAAGAGAGAGAVLSDPRVGLLLHRLQTQLPAQLGGGVPGGQSAGQLLDQLQGQAVSAKAAVPHPLVAGIVAEAAALAQNPTELETSIGQLQSYGVPVVEDGIVRMLGRSLPDWAPPQVEGSAEPPPQNAVRAMERIISMAGDRQQKYKRFGELVTTAVEEFNKGSLGRAVTMLDLAHRMIDDEEVEPTIVETVRDKAYQALEEKQLRTLAEDEDSHYLLRRMMGFFPQLEPEQLFVDLEEEENRDRRRLLLLLLSAQGEEARAAALDALRGVVGGERSFPWFVERNLVYLLRTIDRPQDAPVDAEVDVLIHESALDNPLPLIREAMATLGQLESERVVQTLVARVNELEDALTGDRQIPHGEEEAQSLLDTAITMLARTGTPEARRCLIAHGLKRQPHLGNTLGRLAKLGSHDLSDDSTAVQRLVGALREELPTKVLGVSVGGRRKADNAERLIEALSGTDLPVVREAFSDIGKKYSGQPLGAAAEQALGRMGTQPQTEEASTAALAGDLGLFGLPSLLQNLSDSNLSGALTVLDAVGQTAATIQLDSGMIRRAQVGHLHGDSAIYQMLERPILGRFVFVESENDSDINMEKGEAKPIQPLLFEGIRRYDEFMRAVALAPDDARFNATEHKPTKAPDEPNMDLLKSVWYKAVEGSTPVECEAEFPVDAYRIRRLFEHWITEGALSMQSEKSVESSPTDDTHLG